MEQLTEKQIRLQMNRQTEPLMDKRMELLMKLPMGKHMEKQYNHYNVQNHANNFHIKHAHYAHKSAEMSQVEK